MLAACNDGTNRCRCADLARALGAGIPSTDKPVAANGFSACVTRSVERLPGLPLRVRELRLARARAYAWVGAASLRRSPRAGGSAQVLLRFFVDVDISARDRLADCRLANRRRLHRGCRRGHWRRRSCGRLLRARSRGGGIDCRRRQLGGRRFDGRRGGSGRRRGGCLCGWLRGRRIGAQPRGRIAELQRLAGRSCRRRLHHGDISLGLLGRLLDLERARCAGCASLRLLASSSRARSRDCQRSRRHAARPS